MYWKQAIRKQFWKKTSVFATALICGFDVSATTLQEVYDQALQFEHQLKADEAAYKAGLEAVNTARSALLPQLTAQALYQDQITESQNPNPDPLFLNRFNQEREGTIYRANLTQTLFDMNAWFTYRQGAATTDQAKMQFAADQQAFIIRVAQAYFNVLRAADVLENSIAQERALKHQLEQTKQRFEVGLTAITDVHDARASYDGARADTLGNRNNLGVAFEALEVLTGEVYTDVQPLGEDFPVQPPEPVDRQEWVEFALGNNNALKVAKLAADAARQGSRAATSNHLPTISASYTYDDQNIYLGLYDQSVETIGLNVNLPLFSGGNISASRRQAARRYEQAQEQYLQTKRQTIQSARSQHLNVVTDVATISARKQAIISSESSLEATQAGYEVGTRDFVDVLNAQQGVFQARSNYYNALYDYVLNTLNLKQTAGTLNPADIMELNRWLDTGKSVERSSFTQ
ncbi:hypothetical protein GCM10007877_05940 [Marinibactrum halimedae]|uniref:Type I secretion protein TolC n=2 Tax=Marinibactrum halimedae TaxID=1444977 RepID=A0AA37T7Y0_9GAMM|nr:hypothetical protein GCM10007877_05940 [Marinibactrum halimedae]